MQNYNIECAERFLGRFSRIFRVQPTGTESTKLIVLELNWKEPIVEILSTSTESKERTSKRELYQRAGVHTT